MNDFPDYEAAVGEYFKRFGASTDERTDLGADIKAIVDAALGDKLLYRKSQPESEITQYAWLCNSCKGDHGGEGCDNPDFDILSQHWEIVRVWPREPSGPDKHRRKR